MNPRTTKSNRLQAKALSSVLLSSVLSSVLTLMITLTGVSCAPCICRAATESQLATAVRRKNLPMVLNLLTDGADVNARDEGVEQTPLMRAALIGDPQITQALLEHGADVNARDDEGNTALMLAANSGASRVVELLLQHGAAPNSRNADGATALSFARSKGRVAIARTLERATVRQNKTRLQRQG